MVSPLFQLLVIIDLLSVDPRLPLSTSLGTFLSCAVFTSNALDMSISISTRKTELFVFLVLILMALSSALLVKTTQ